MGKINETCEKCGCTMVVYYRKYCPRCEPPKIQTMKYYNLYQALYYIEYAIGIKDFKKKFWDEVTRHCDDISNDSIKPIFNEGEEETPFTNELFKHLGIEEDSFKFEISW